VARRQRLRMSDFGGMTSIQRPCIASASEPLGEAREERCSLSMIPDVVLDQAMSAGSMDGS
jgi:hypothetical protein